MKAIRNVNFKEVNFEADMQNKKTKNRYSIWQKTNIYIF